MPAVYVPEDLAAAAAADLPAMRLFPRPADPVDRRRRPRVAQERAVKVYDPAAGRYFAGHTRDRSAGGYCLDLPARCPARPGQTAMAYVGPDLAGRGAGLVSAASLVPVRYVWVRREDVAIGANGRMTEPRVVCGVEVLAEANAGTPPMRRAA